MSCHSGSKDNNFVKGSYLWPRTQSAWHGWAVAYFTKNLRDVERRVGAELYPPYLAYALEALFMKLEETHQFDGIVGMSDYFPTIEETEL